MEPRSKRRRIEIEQPKKRIRSIETEFKVQEKNNTIFRNSIQDTLGIDLEAWIGLVHMCSKYLFMLKFANNQFYKCFKIAIVESKIVLKYNGDSTKSKTKHSHCTKKVDYNMWASIVIIKDNRKEYKIYRMLITELETVLYNMFTKNIEWINTKSPESTIPSTIIRACVSYFPNAIKNIKHELIDIGRHIHQTLDVIKMIRDYGTEKYSILSAGIVDDEEDDDDIASITVLTNTFTKSRVSTYTGSSIDVPPKPGHQKLYYRQFMCISKDHKLEIEDDEEETFPQVHPYDISLYAFIEARKRSNDSKTWVLDNYDQVCREIRSYSSEKKRMVLSELAYLKQFIFGAQSSVINMGYVVEVEKLISSPLSIHSSNHLFYRVASEIDGNTVLQFDRLKVSVVDVALAVGYYNIKYSSIFKLVSQDAMKWDQSNIFLTMPTSLYQTVVESIVFFECFRSRNPLSCQLYPIIAQRYIHGSSGELEQCINIIKRTVRNTRLNIDPKTIWDSRLTDDDAVYYRLLPKILAKYRDKETLLAKLVHPYNAQNTMLFGPTYKWCEKHTFDRNHTERFVNRVESNALRKINWGFSGWSGKIGNIYVGLDAFFSPKNRQVMAYYMVKNIYEFLIKTEHMRGKYEDLLIAIESVLSSEKTKNIDSFSDEDVLNIPLFMKTRQTYDPENPTLSDYTAADIFKLCADEMTPSHVAMDIFESISARKHDSDSTHKKNISIQSFAQFLPTAKTVAELVEQELKSRDLYKREIKLENETDFLTFFLESIERLSYFHATNNNEDENRLDTKYRGNQNVKSFADRWLPIDTRVIQNNNRFCAIPVYYRESSPIYSNQFIPCLWSISKKFTRERSFIKNTIRDMGDIGSLMVADEELINCMLCRPIKCM